jgi:hypothetical protein
MPRGWEAGNSSRKACGIGGLRSLGKKVAIVWIINVPHWPVWLKLVPKVVVLGGGRNFGGGECVLKGIMVDQSLSLLSFCISAWR